MEEYKEIMAWICGSTIFLYFGVLAWIGLNVTINGYFMKGNFMTDILPTLTFGLFMIMVFIVAIGIIIGSIFFELPIYFIFLGIGLIICIIAGINDYF